MCGIAGVLSLGPDLAPKDAAETERMMSVLAHRGPDGAGLYAGKKCLLGNTRLKVTDLTDAAALPLSDEKRRVWIAYNGAVTNCAGLKTRFGLEKRHSFKTTSDAEVLVRLYQDLGIDFVRHLSGMFAFCLYDVQSRKAYLVRDFYGMRPLFTMIANERLYFASEIKSFLELEGFDRKLDYEGIYDFLSLAYIPGERTPFASVKELGGGQMIEVDLERGSHALREYYRLQYRPEEEFSEEEAAGELRGLLLESVRRSIAIDVPVGLTLSGGVDSGGLLSLLKELGVSREAHTFSISMSEASFDESPYQRILVKHARPIHHEVRVKPQDVLDNITAHMAYLDEPSGDGAAVPMYLLAQAAKPYVKVLLSGEGGDEIFNAYETHRAFHARRLYRRWTPAPVRRALRALARGLPTSYKKLSLDFVLKRFTEGAELSAPEAHLFWRQAWTDEEKARLMPDGADFRPTAKLFTDMFDAAGFSDELDKISRIDLRYYFIGDLMVKNDRMLMAHSIEGRYPYMNREIVEFTARLPSRFRLKGLQGRCVQKRALAGILPPAIRRRSNMGLEMPYSLWFLDEFRALAEKRFSKDSIERTGFLRHEMVDAMWGDHLAHKRDNGRALWCLLNFLIWFDLFVDNRTYKSYLPQRPGSPPVRITGP